MSIIPIQSSLADGASAVAFEGPDAAILVVDAVPLSDSAQIDLKGEKEDEISIEQQARPAEIA